MASDLITALEDLEIRFPMVQLLFVESGGDNLAAMIHADYYISDNWSIAGGIDYEKSSSTGEGTNGCMVHGNPPSIFMRLKSSVPVYPSNVGSCPALSEKLPVGTMDT